MVLAVAACNTVRASTHLNAEAQPMTDLDQLRRVLAVSSDPDNPDAAAAWLDRMEDLRGCFKELAASLAKDGALAEGWSVNRAADYLWAACSVQAWDLLVSDRGWRPAAASKTIRETVARVLLV